MKKSYSLIKAINAFAFLALFSICSFAQLPHNRNWAIGTDKLHFDAVPGNPVNFSSLPTGPAPAILPGLTIGQTYDLLGLSGNTYNAPGFPLVNGPKNSMYDASGNLLFFVDGGYIFNETGICLGSMEYEAMPSLGVVSVAPGNDRVIILPVPGNCCQYYIVSTGVPAYAETGPAITDIVYQTIDMCQLNTLYDPIHNISGKLINTGLLGDPNAPKAILLDSYDYNCNPLRADLSAHVSIVSTGLINNDPLYPDGHYFIFVVTEGQIKRYRATSSGIFDDSYVYNFPGPMSFQGGPICEGIYEVELHPNSDGSFKMVLPNTGSNPPVLPIPSPYTNESVIGIYDVDPFGIISFNKNALYFYDDSYPIATGALLDPIKGLEFSPDGNFIYATSFYPPYVSVADLSLATPQFQALVPSVGSIASPEDFKYGFIERGRNDKLYFIASNKIAEYDYSSSTWTNNILTSLAATISLTPYNPPAPHAPEDLVLQIPYNIDNFSMDYLYNPAPSNPCCENYLAYHEFNYTTSPGMFGSPNVMTWSNASSSSNPFGVSGAGATVYIENDLVISPYNHLTINNLIFKFGPKGRLIISRNSRVNFNNCILTSVDCDGKMWQGVRLYSLNTFAQSTAPFAVSAMRTPYVVFNNTEVSNAYVGVSSGIFTSTSTPASGSMVGYFPIATGTTPTLSPFFGGGVVIGKNNSTFKNNLYDVVFAKYSPNNLSNFKDCHFITDAVLKDGTTPAYHAWLMQTSGIKFFGNEFKNSALSIAPYSTDHKKRGQGIVSYNSKFYVEAYCSIFSPGGCPPSAQVPNAFENLFSGIYAKSMGSPFSSASIKRNRILNCQKGVYLGGMDGSVVYDNYFDVGEDYAGTVFGTFVHSYGAYLDNCSRFDFSENDFTTTHNGYYGAYVYNSENESVESGVSNTVYHNTFSNLFEASVAGGLNDVVAIGTSTDPMFNSLQLDGLDFKCNIYSTNKTFDLMGNKGGYSSGTTNLGISTYQGRCYTDPGTGLDDQTSPANNLFSPVTPSLPNPYGLSGDFYTETGLPYVTYTFANSSALNNNPASTNFASANESSCYTSDLSNHNTACPISPETSIRSVLFAEISQFKNFIAQNNSKIDGGNTTTLLNFIASNSNNKKVRDKLTDYTPYLSDAVLIALINKTPAYAPWVIEDVLNAQGSLSDAVLQAALDRTTALPSYLIADIFIESKPVGKATMINLINKTSLPVWVVTDVAKANSPLTNDELIALLERSPALPNWSIKDIFMINTPLQPEVQNALDNRIPPLANWVIDDISNSTFIAAHPLSRVENSSGMIELALDNSYLNRKIDLNVNALMRSYIFDTTINNGPDSLIWLTKVFNIKHAKCEEVKANILKGDYTRAKQLNDSLLSLGISSINPFCNFMHSVIELNQDSLGYYRLYVDFIKKGDIEYLASIVPDEKQTKQAQAIMEAIFGFKYPERFDEPQPGPELPRMYQSLTSSRNGGTGFAKLYPNPNDGNFTLGYYPDNDGMLTTVNIFDNSGKLVLSKAVTLNAGNTINLSLELSNGVYIVEMINEFNEKQIEKLVIR